jgi:hypothetical protein
VPRLTPAQEERPRTAEARQPPRMQLAAVDQVESIQGLRVMRVEPDDIVTMAEIADRSDRTRESVRLLIAGQRGPGGFPRPMSHSICATRVAVVGSQGGSQLGTATERFAPSQRRVDRRSWAAPAGGRSCPNAGRLGARSEPRRRLRGTRHGLRPTGWPTSRHARPDLVRALPIDVRSESS